MRCRYSRWGQLSSEKHEAAVDAGVEEEGCPRRRGARHGGGRYRALPASLTAITRRTHATRGPIEVMREMVCRAHAARSSGIRPPRGDAGMPPLLAVENPRLDQAHFLVMRICI